MNSQPRLPTDNAKLNWLG